MKSQLDRENWMSHLNPNVRILDSYIPASHDSSCYPTANVFQMLANEWVGAVTQLAGYTAQLNTGVRYFDMRVVEHNGALVMHHSSYYYETFENVLRQINNFAHTHQGEYIFLDIDTSNDVGLIDPVLAMLKKVLDENLFATAHVNPDGTFNTQVTWGEMGGKQFVVTFYAKGQFKAPWFCDRELIRESPFDDFNKKSITEILAYLSEHENEWQKDKMFIAQAINTPRLSFVKNPGVDDAEAESYLNQWIMSHGRGSKLNVVMRDFVNAGYNRQVIQYVIELNDFSSPPVVSNSGKVIHLLSNVRLHTADNHYLKIDAENNLTLTKDQDEADVFQVRDHDYSGTGPLWYSGNMNADTTNARGNFLMMPLKHNPSGNQVLSINKAYNQLFNGIEWSASVDDETFTCFNPDDLSYGSDRGDAQVRDGSRVIIRSMKGASNDLFHQIIHTVGEHVVAGFNPFIGPAFEKAMQDSSGNHLFLMTSYDGKGKAMISAASPGSNYATTFFMEQAREATIRGGMTQITTAKDENLLWGLGTDGGTYRSTDRGYEWKEVQNASEEVFAELSATSDSAVAWAIHQGGEPYRTNDGGTTWYKVGGLLASISALDYDHAWGVNSAGNIFRTSDGQTWQSVGGILSSVSAVDFNTAWGVTTSGEIFRTNDGQSWKAVGGLLTKISAVSYEVAWGVTSGGELYRTTDGAASWEAIAPGYRWVAAIDENLAWAVSQDYAVKLINLY